jgi:hypothetical protein
MSYLSNSNKHLTTLKENFNNWDLGLSEWDRAKARAAE